VPITTLAASGRLSRHCASDFPLDGVPHIDAQDNVYCRVIGEQVDETDHGRRTCQALALPRKAHISFPSENLKEGTTNC
jgi:hypothetical protein